MQALLCWREDVLVRLEVSGHAPPGQSELCLAVSCLLRSSAAALDSLELDAADWELQLPCEGEFRWHLHRLPEMRQTPLQARLQGISLVLACGLRRLAQDYPELELVELAEQEE